MELVDVVDSKSTAGDSVPVRVRSPAPTRRKRHIACDELFSFHCKAYRALLASKPNPLPLGFGLVLGTKLRAGSDPVQCAKKQSSEGAAVFLFGFHSRWPLHPSVFQCPGQMNCPSAKVFAAGENACTAHQRRLPDGRLSGISVNRSKKTSSARPLRLLANCDALRWSLSWRVLAPFFTNIDFNSPLHPTKRLIAPSLSDQAFFLN